MPDNKTGIKSPGVTPKPVGGILPQRPVSSSFEPSNNYNSNNANRPASAGGILTDALQYTGTGNAKDATVYTPGALTPGISYALGGAPLTGAYYGTSSGAFQQAFAMPEPPEDEDKGFLAGLLSDPVKLVFLAVGSFLVFTLLKRR